MTYYFWLGYEAEELHDWPSWFMSGLTDD